MESNHPHPVERKLDKLRLEVSSYEYPRLEEERYQRIKSLFG